MDKTQIIKGYSKTLILAALHTKEMHGYAIKQWIKKKSGDEILCTSSSLYTTLHQLEDEGLVSYHLSNVSKGPQRKIYSLSPLGKKQFTEYKQSISMFHKTIERIIE